MELVLRPAEPRDYRRICDLIDESRPHLPPMDLEQFAFAESPERQTHGFSSRTVAEIHGVVVAQMNVTTPLWQKAEDTYQGHIVVDCARRGEGIGSALYEHLSKILRDLAAVKVYGHAYDTNAPATRFMEMRGFEPTGYTYRQSRLDVSKANMEGFVGLEEQLAPQGIRVITFNEAAGGNPDRLLRAMYDLDAVTIHDAPSSEESQMVPFDLYRQDVLDSPGHSPDMIWVAMAGEQLVGNALLETIAPDSAGNDYTGVRPDYRGCGIARALKKRTVDWARDNGIKYIYTSNAATNDRMLSINVRLGYEPIPGLVEFVKPLP